ncbi:MAG: EAL domain-containing protein [Sulfuricellaceae bacterium]|nr:EAL domain-containing protein [Sulfuricellaceae bacterium]
MTLKLLSLLFVLGGSLCLVLSLRPTKLMRNENQKITSWNILFLLILFFVVGYLAFAVLVLLVPVNYPEFMVSLVFLGGGIFVLMTMKMSSFTLKEIKEIAAVERHRACHDDLTGLPNRRLFRDRLGQIISKARSDSTPIAVLLIELNRISEVNVTLGHRCGDQILKQAAERLQGLIGAEDILSRQGSDEFVVAFPGTDTDGAFEKSRSIVQAMEDHFPVEGHSLDIGISIGIALYPLHGKNSHVLLQRADTAVAGAKHNSSGFALYSPERDRNSLDRLTMASALRGALKKAELALHYQPKLDIKTRQVSGVEALVRWSRPGYGMVPPAEFIPLAERTGMIRPLTIWVLNTALRQAAIWHKEGLDLDVAVNISARNLLDADIVETVEGILNAWEVPPGRLVLEITESSIMADPERAYDIITRLHAIGVRLSIDDFGTGYSSLAYIKRLPAMEIKIDKSFVQNMDTDENDAVIVRSTIDLAHNMGRKVVAEGIESTDIYDLLDMLGCDTAQGFHICHPLPAEELQPWLESFRDTSPP